MLDTLFSPHQDLASRLLAELRLDHDDGAHDLAHLARVWRSARHIQAEEGGDSEVLFAATLLHDCVWVRKDSPQRALASQLAAEKAAALLNRLGWPAPRIASVVHAVEAHSYSAGIPPTTIEARTLQDADRLDAIGMIGVARCFYTAGLMGSRLYDARDPAAQRRALDDQHYALDHFHTKLLKLSDGFQTAAGQRLAQQRHRDMQRFVAMFMDEISGGPAVGMAPPQP